MNPRESAEHIIKNAKYLKVLPDGIEKLAKEVIEGVKAGKIDVRNFSQHELHPSPTDKNAIEWIFVVDTLNFCFWTPRDYTKYKVNGYTGYFALCAAVNRALNEGIDITDAAFYAKIDIALLRYIFRSDDGATQVPLLEERLKCLHEVGMRLLDKWNGKFENVLREAQQSAEILLRLIVQEFPCFKDEAEYCGERVSLYKRAQILIGDLYACFGGKELGEFHDLHVVTMFADYRVPQVLVHFGCLEYSDDLLEELKKDVIMKNGDPREVEIRGASIYVVEKVKDFIKQQQLEDVPPKKINSILIDHFLWDYRRAHAAELEYIPFHKVYSVYY